MNIKIEQSLNHNMMYEKMGQLSGTFLKNVDEEKNRSLTITSEVFGLTLNFLVNLFSGPIIQ